MGRSPTRLWPRRTACHSNLRFSRATACKSYISARPNTSRGSIKVCPKMGNNPKPMKKLLCILVGAALLGGCEDKTVVAPTTASPGPEKKVENNTTVVNPTTEKEKTKETTNTNTTTTATTPTSSTSSSTSTTTTSSPSP